MRSQLQKAGSRTEHPVRLPALSEQFPDKTISSRLSDILAILERVKD